MSRATALFVLATTALATTTLTAVPATAAAKVTAATPCPEGARIDQGTSPERTYILCSYDPQQGRMDKDLWSTVDGQTFKAHGPAPEKAITAGFAVASDSTLAIAGSAADQCVVHMTFNGGDSWQETLTVTDGAPASELTFTDAQHGSVVCGWEKPVTYRTSDGGRTWVADPS